MHAEICSPKSTMLRETVLSPSTALTCISDASSEVLAVGQEYGSQSVQRAEKVRAMGAV